MTPWPWLDQFLKGADIRLSEPINDTIAVRDVVRFIKNMSEADRIRFKSELVYIDFKYGNTLRFLRDFAEKNNVGGSSE